VRLEHGVLAGIEGKLVRDSDAWRIVVSVDALHRSVAVEVDREMFCLLDEQTRSVASGAC
jgi:hypothetical protein